MPKHCLVVANDRRQLRALEGLWGPIADYCVYGDSLMGSRYDRIIAICPYSDSALEMEMKRRELAEHLPCRVALGGELVVMDNGRF